MSSSSWNGESGDWNNVTLWSAGVPGPGDSAVFATGDNFTVTFDTTDQVASIAGYVADATFAVTAGELQTASWSWDGAFLLSGGTLEVAGVNPSWYGPASISGGALIVSSSDGFSASFADGLTQTGGVIDIGAGALNIAGTSSLLDGTLTGAGALKIAGDATATFGSQLVLATADTTLASAATLVLATGSALDMQGNFFAQYSSTLISNGQDFTLGQNGAGTFAGTFAGGTLQVDGVYDLGGLVVTDSGTLVIGGKSLQDSSNITLGLGAFGDDDVMLIAQGGTLDNVGGGGIEGNEESTLTVSGTYVANAPGLTTGIAVQQFTLAPGGVLLVQGNADLDLQGATALNATAVLQNGSIGGSGTLQLGAFELATVGGTALDVGHLLIGSYYTPPGELQLTAAQLYQGQLIDGDGYIDTNGFVFTLGTASSGTLGNIVDGGGTLVVAGSMALQGASITGAGTELLITGLAYANTGFDDLGGTAGATSFSIGSTGTFDLGSSNGVTGTGTADLVNAGLITLSDGAPYAGPAFYDVTFTNTGIVDIGIGELQLSAGTATLGGTIEGAGTLALDGDVVTLAAGLKLDVDALQLNGARVTLEGNETYTKELQAGSGTTIDLQGYTFTVAAGALDATFTGGGTVVVGGAVDGGGGGYDGSGIDLEGSGTTLLDNYIINEDAASLGMGEVASDSTTLSITGTAQYIISDIGEIVSGSTNSTIINDGTFHEASIYPLGPPNVVTVGTFFNQGTIIDSTGTLQLITSLVNDGFITVAQNMLISGQVGAAAGATGTFDIGAHATLGFTGNILTNPVTGGLVAASQIVSFTGADGVLDIQNPALFAGTIHGFAAGDIIDVGIVPDSTGAASTFAYGNNVLTLLSVIKVSASTSSTMAVGTLALPGINPADLQLFYNDTSGDIDIELANPSVGDAPFFEGSVYNSTWIGPNGDNWNNPADWQTQYYEPGAPTNPQIENAVPPQGYDIVLPTALTLDYDAASTPTGEFTANAFSGASGSTLAMSGGTLAASYGFYDSGLVSLSGGRLDVVSGEGGGAFLGTLDLGAGGIFEVDNGTFDLSGNGSSFFGSTSSIAGTLAGLGDINLLGGTYDIAASADLAIATLSAAATALILQGDQVFNGGTLINTSIFNLNGNDLLLSAGGLLVLQSGTVSGGGTITVAGSADLGGAITGAGTEILITGTAQTGYGGVTLGTLQVAGSAASSVVVAQSGTFFNPYFAGLSGGWTGTLVNNGLIVQTSPVTAYDEVGQQEQLELFINAGTGVLDIDAGNMVLYLGSAELGGVIEGGGTLELSDEVATLAAAVELEVANVSLSSTTLTLDSSQNYGGVFDETYGDIDTGGNTLALGGAEGFGSGQLSAGSIIGQLALGGSYFVSGLALAGTGTTLTDDKYIALGANGLQLGESNTDATAVVIASGAEAELVGAGGFISGDGAATFANAGLLKDSSTGFNQINLASFINTGTIDVLYARLEVVASAGVIGGLVTGGGELYLNSLGTITLEAGATLDVGTITLADGLVQLGGNLTYAGDFSAVNPTLNTNGYVLDLDGSGTIGGYIVGGGAVDVSGSLYAGNIELWAAATTLAVTGSLELGAAPLYAGGTNATGAGALLTVGATGTLNLAQDQFIGTFGIYDNFTFDNAGLIEKTGNVGATTIAATAFLNTGTILNDPGIIDILGTLVNDGTIIEEAGGSFIFGSIGGTGLIIDDPAAITFSGAVNAGQTVQITGGGGTLVLADAGQFQGIIAGFGQGDIIDLTTIAPAAITGESFSGDVLTLDDAVQNIELTFASGSYTGFTFGTDGGAGSYLVEQALCYGAGTRILTPRGEVAIESLAVGDLVVTRFGGVQPIRWIGRQDYDARFIAKNREKIPVTIAAGALGEGLPARDVNLSPGHSVLLGEVLVLASALVNGITVTQPAPSGMVAYYNLEFASHDCVLAEGIWGETYADAPGQRAQFHNAADFHARYPAATPAAALHLCAVRPESGPALAAALRPVVARAARRLTRGKVEGYIDLATPHEIAGWLTDRATPELPLQAEIWFGEVLHTTVLACEHRADLAAAGLGRGRCAFHFVPAMPLGAEILASLRILAPDGTALPMTETCRATRAA